MVPCNACRTIAALVLIVAVAACFPGCKPDDVKLAGGLVASGNAPASTPADVSTSPDASAVPQEPILPAASVAEAGSDPAVSTPPAASEEPPSAPPGEPPAPAPSSTPLQANPDLIPPDQAASGRLPPAPAANQGSPAQATTQEQPGVLPIHLSAGVAVPQSLPTGTQMGMSVDYVLRRPLNRSSKYVWVIAAAGGEIYTEVQLKEKGNLSAFVMLRPEDRPFNVRIDEVQPGGKRIRASNVAPMQTSY